MVDLSWLFPGVLLPLVVAAVLLARARRSRRLLRRHERTVVALLLAVPVGLVAAHIVAGVVNGSALPAAAVGVAAAAVQFRWQSSVLRALQAERTQQWLSRPETEQDARDVLTASDHLARSHGGGDAPGGDQASLNRARALLEVGGYSGGEVHLHEAFEILERLSRQVERPWEVRFLTAHLLAEAWDVRAQVFGDGSGYGPAVAGLESVAAQAPAPQRTAVQERVAPAAAGFCVWQAHELTSVQVHEQSEDQPEPLRRRLTEILDRGLAAVEHGMTGGSGSIEWYADLLGKRGLLQGFRDPRSAAAHLRPDIAALPSLPHTARAWPMVALAEALIAGVEQGATDTEDQDLSEAEHVLREVLSLQPRFEPLVRRLLARVDRLRRPPFRNG